MISHTARMLLAMAAVATPAMMDDADRPSPWVRDPDQRRPGHDPEIAAKIRAENARRRLENQRRRLPKGHPDRLED